MLGGDRECHRKGLAGLLQNPEGSKAHLPGPCRQVELPYRAPVRSGPGHSLAVDGGVRFFKVQLIVAGGHKMKA